MHGAEYVIVLHLAYDHQSVRMLATALRELPEIENYWWLHPNERIEEPMQDWPGLLATHEEVNMRLREGVNAVVVHRLKPDMFPWIESIGPEVPIVWATWGDDYYRTFPELSKNLFLPKTAVVNALLLKFSIGLKRLMGRAQLNREIKRFSQVITRIDAVSTLLEQDAYFLPFLPPPPMKTYPTWYNQLPERLPSTYVTQQPRRVLIGTSAGNTGNQPDLLWNLWRSVGRNGVKASGNLGYGGVRFKYAVHFMGKCLFGSNWTSQTSRMSLEVYLDWIQSHSVLMIYNIRTQGTGSIVIGLWSGMRICIREECHFSRFMQTTGFVFTKLAGNYIAEEALEPLGETDRLHNRQLVQQVFGKPGVQAAFLKFVTDVRLGQLPNRQRPSSFDKSRP